MQNTLEACEQANQVVALYPDSALSFKLSNTATFADLAERMASPGDELDGQPIAVYVKFGASFEPVTLLVANLRR